MRWVADDARQRIETAVKYVTEHDCSGSRLEAAVTLLVAKMELCKVLEDMARLEKEQPHPEPRVVALTTEELRRIYPERFINSN